MSASVSGRITFGSVRKRMYSGSIKADKFKGCFPVLTQMNLSTCIPSRESTLICHSFRFSRNVFPIDVYKRQALSPSMPTLSKTTVYNTLKLFSEQGAALMLTIDEKNTNFDADTSVHSHFLCKRCGHIYDLECPEAIKQVENLEMDGHQVSEVHYYYKGICKNCLSKDKETRID